MPLVSAGGIVAGTAPPGGSWFPAGLLLRFRVCGWPSSIPCPTVTVGSFTGCDPLLFGSAMVLSIVLGVVAIRRRDFDRHGAWMIRAYAIALGAGTQFLTHLPWVLILGEPGELPGALLMGTGWVINLAVAEWVIRKRLTRPTRTSSVAVSHLP